MLGYSSTDKVNVRMDEDGSFRTVLRSTTGQTSTGTGTEVPTDPDIIVPMYSEITDVDFWCNLRSVNFCMFW